MYGPVSNSNEMFNEISFSLFSAISIDTEHAANGYPEFSNLCTTSSKKILIRCASTSEPLEGGSIFLKCLAIESCRLILNELIKKILPDSAG